MWFAFGFISLLGFVAIAVYNRLDARWTGFPGWAGSVRYEYRIDRYRGIVHCRIGVPARADFDFALKPESLPDRICKALGISREYRVADEEFDNAVYIVSDDAGLCKLLSASPQLRAGVLGLFRTYRDRRYRLRHIRCHRGRLWVRFRPRRDFDEAQMQQVAFDTLSALQPLASALASAPVETSPGWRDPFVLKAVVLLSLSSGLAINGAVQLFRISWRGLTVPFTQDPAALAVPAIALGLGVTLLLAIATLALVGRSARAHLVLFEILLVGSFGASTTAYAGLRDLNMEWDRRPAQFFEVAVLEKTIRHSRRRGTRHYIRVEDWTNWSPDREIRVPERAFHSLHDKARIRVYVKPGRLGFRWVRSLEGPNGWVVR